MKRVLIFVFSVFFLLPSMARADFGDCNHVDYMSVFPDAPTAIDLNCVEIFNFGYATPGGARYIRGIKDISGDWAFAAGAEAAVERGAQLAVTAFSELGNYDIDDVTLLFLDDAHDLAERPGRIVLAMTDGLGGIGGGRAGECLITLYALSPGTDTLDLTVTVAHEIFHCLQYRSLTAAQMSTVGTGGDWWIEGSAELFSAYAVPGSGPYTDRSETYDAGVDAGLALNEMRHEAGIFFFWLVGRSGLSTLMPFLYAMAGSGDASAQQAAMRSALSDADWLRFAQDYVDRKIKHPQDHVLALYPSILNTYGFTENGTERIPLEPFVLTHGFVDYTCGEWRNTVRPETANLSARRDTETEWSIYPETIDAVDAGEAHYRFAAMHTAGAAVDFVIDAERIRSCEPCAGSDAVDACLVGTWQMSGGGAVEWMRANGIPITRSRSGPRIVTFRGDGAYGTEPFDLSLTVRQGDMVGQGEGYMTVAAGRWSAADGALNICQDSGTMSGEVTVTTPRHSGTMPVSQPGAGQLTQSYSCSERSLSTTLDFTGMSPMRTEYSKISE